MVRDTGLGFSNVVAVLIKGTRNSHLAFLAGRTRDVRWALLSDTEFQLKTERRSPELSAWIRPKPELSLTSSYTLPIEEINISLRFTE